MSGSEMTEEYSLDIETKRGNWGNGAFVGVDDEGECDICHSSGRVMLFDTSECEYATLQMCISCINKTYEEGAKHNDALQPAKEG